MELDELVDRVVSGDTAAWHALLTQIVPQIEAIARSHQAMRSRRLATHADELAEVSTAVLGRLSQADYQNLRRYCEQRKLARPQAFESWLYGATDFAIREHLRSRYGRAPRSAESVPAPSKRELNTEAGRLEDEQLGLSLQRALGITTRLNLAVILKYMADHFSELEHAAMRLYYAEDSGFVEIAEALSLSNEVEAAKLVRRLNARLRHHFTATL
jgi:hypothetical protein